MRAQHNVQAVARLTVADKKRLIKIVWHRISRHAGASREIQIEPIL
jgi:hypothetical protein